MATNGSHRPYKLVVFSAGGDTLGVITLDDEWGEYLTTCTACDEIRSVRGNSVQAALTWLNEHHDTNDGETSPWCEWYAACANAATTTRDHPVLGVVPICARCDRIAAVMSAP